MAKVPGLLDPLKYLGFARARIAHVSLSLSLYICAFLVLVG